MGYLNPFPRGTRRSQLFGASPNNGVNPAGGHNGDDYAVPVGTPVRAAGDGTVVFAGEFDTTYADNWGWNLNFGGRMVVLNLDGPTGPYIEYGHNAQVLVKTGDRVRRGQVIAISGNTDGGTGVSSGPHCHVGALPPNFNLGTSTYGRVNPNIYLTDYWEGGIELSPAGNTTPQTPSEEDELASILETLIAEIRAVPKAVQEQINTLHVQVKPSAVWAYKNGEDRDAYQILRDGPKDTWRVPIDYRDPATGELIKGGTTAETALSYLDANTSKILDAKTVVASIPDELAREVLDLLADRLGGKK